MLFTFFKTAVWVILNKCNAIRWGGGVKKQENNRRTPEFPNNPVVIRPKEQKAPWRFSRQKIR